MSVTVLRASSAVAPGLYSGAAWKALFAAPTVAASRESEATEAVVAAGVDVKVLGSVRDLDEGVWIENEGDDLGEAEILEASWGRRGSRVLDLVDTVDALHGAEKGCPWHKGQTHQTLSRFLLEETYETLEAIDGESAEDLEEELGDLLFQPILHARIAGEFDIDAVAAGIVDKIVRRHPHVFGDAEAEDLYENWDKIKGAEKSHRTSPADGVPKNLPALAYAQKILQRTDSEWAVSEHPENYGSAAMAEEVGEKLLELVDEARKGGVDAETALRQAVARRLE
ncbi:MazG nucleotide pyrophosphohydrolase domain-containing protein [Salininema proteolyticum]|uniref:MazG nucleotide pyrophosphohydrolase domain-containing protein n=1 Tax=Salininema proteolyticum TaxID=1607685 RepID=A0ABV8U008_9ACTN